MWRGKFAAGLSVAFIIASLWLLNAATADAQVTTYSEDTLRSQSKGWTMIALIALIGLMSVLLLWLIFAMWRVSNQFGQIRQSLRELSASRDQEKPVDPWVAAGQRMKNAPDDEPDDDSTTDPETRRGDDDGPDIVR